MTEQEKFEEWHRSDIPQFEGELRYCDVNMSPVDVWLACATQKQAEIDAMRKELERAKAHSVMLLNAVIYADVALSEYEDSNHQSRKETAKAITATSEQIESYKQEIIAQAKAEQRESDANLCDSMHGERNGDCAEAIRNNKE